MESIERAYTVAPRSRLTIWVDRENPRLASTAVSTRLTSNVPVVAERAMWWPGPTAETWQEAHVEAGATETGTLWAIADAEVRDAPSTDTFVLVTTAQPSIARIRMTLAFEDGQTVSRELPLLPNRNTIWVKQEFPEAANRRFGVIIESLPTRITLSPVVPIQRVPLMVEKAIYSRDFAAGAVSLATKLPDPEM